MREAEKGEYALRVWYMLVNEFLKPRDWEENKYERRGYNDKWECAKSQE